MKKQQKKQKWKKKQKKKKHKMKKYEFNKSEQEKLKTFERKILRRIQRIKTTNTKEEDHKSVEDPLVRSYKKNGRLQRSKEDRNVQTKLSVEKMENKKQEQVLEEVEKHKG